MPSFARECWARSSIPFWQKMTFAPLFRTVSTIRLSMDSSSSRNAWSWVGSVISIFASISVFLTSRAASTRAIFASFTSFGIPGWTRSLSTMIPSTSSVSAMEPPCFFTTWRLSSSTDQVPSGRSSAIVATALTEMSARSSLWPLAGFADIRALPGPLAREAVPRGDDGRVDVLLHEVLRLLQQLPGEDDGRRRAVPGLLVLGLRDLDEHLRRGMLDVDLLEDRHAIVRDDDVPEAVHEHLVQAARAEGRADRIGHGLRRGDVVELRSLAALAARPSLPYENLCAGWHPRYSSHCRFSASAYVGASI